MDAADAMISFANIASTRTATLQQVLTTVLQAENSTIVPILRALVIMYVGRQGFLMMFGHLTFHRMMDSVVRALVVVFLAGSVANYNTYVVQKIFVAIPQAITNLGVGSYAPTAQGKSSAAQFDQVSAAGDAIAAQILGKTEVTSPSTWINGATAFIGLAFFHSVLNCIFGIWLFGMGLIAIALAIGPMLLPLELFERTRGFVDQWIGKFVGFIAHGLGATIVLAMQMQGLQNMLNQVNGVAGTNAPAAVGMLLHCVGDSVLDFLTIAAVPIAFGFGAGTVAALVAPAARLSSATVFAGAQVIKAGGRLARTGSGADA